MYVQKMNVIHAEKQLEKMELCMIPYQKENTIHKIRNRYLKVIGPPKISKAEIDSAWESLRRKEVK